MFKKSITKNDENKIEKSTKALVPSYYNNLIYLPNEAQCGGYDTISNYSDEKLNHLMENFDKIEDEDNVAAQWLSTAIENDFRDPFVVVDEEVPLLTFFRRATQFYREHSILQLFRLTVLAILIFKIKFMTLLFYEYNGYQRRLGGGIFDRLRDDQPIIPQDNFLQPWIVIIVDCILLAGTAVERVENYRNQNNNGRGHLRRGLLDGVEFKKKNQCIEDIKEKAKNLYEKQNSGKSFTDDEFNKEVNKFYEDFEKDPAFWKKLAEKYKTN